MDIILAGFNVDGETLRAVQEEHPDWRHLTPETISAAYARISRDPRPVNELRALACAEVEKARRSNRTIVFDMGHNSVAEHAVFNLDVLRISRLLAEEIEKFRLVSYLEKSQRYILLEDDVHLPEEVAQAGLADLFRQTITAQNGCYHRLYERLRERAFAMEPGAASDRGRTAVLEGLAKEDARYAVALATETQLGMTLNARNLELMIRRLAAHPLAEAAQARQKLFAAVQAAAPSLVRYTEATDYDRLTRLELRERLAEILPGKPADSAAVEAPSADVLLVYATPAADEAVLAGIAHTVTNLSLARCREAVGRMSDGERRDLMERVFRHLQPYDAAPREFEYAVLHFELILSASCFAQLKRHRMATLTAQDYDPALGATIPPTVVEVGMEKALREVLGRTEEAYRRIRRVAPQAAAYILTNAHRRRVSLQINARELYHMVRVRADGEAQWDIRETVRKMLALARPAMPLTLLMAGGKDEFALLRRNLDEKREKPQAPAPALG